MSNSAIKFGAGGASVVGIPTSLFGSLGGNPSINSLTNANAIAAQTAASNQANLAMQAAAQPTGSGVINDMLDPSGIVGTGRFNPTAKNIGMGIFGDMGARNRSLYPSALFVGPSKNKTNKPKKPVNTSIAMMPSSAAEPVKALIKGVKNIGSKVKNYINK
tara:strand:- start:2811 stop:3293 length:483 start_codon:yes stop_codon:yes gene_type:complete